MRVKICGITNLEDALDAIAAGASALGFVFYKPSPRYISVEEALTIVDALPPFVQTVGLFVNENEAVINEVCSKAKMQLAQIIDDEEKLDYTQIKPKTIRVLRAKTPEDIVSFKDQYLLVDAFVPSFGGEGKRVALEWFKGKDCSKMILAGGLEASNVHELKGLNFFALDVSSGVEAYKGKKDKDKMRAFIKAAHEL
ncbi:MAG: phosphoribosylanthranilate isomerase [Arcobacteraceae bacterium]|jgi:phosphoribosylanthranilate isomerase|nr:phosphoribosylanthranilate isomerase [Arcobacteraceae bacterium]